MTQPTTTGSRDLARWLFRVPVDPMTYRSIGYLVLAMPLGLAYGILLLVGVTLGVSLTVVLIGPIILLVTLLLIVSISWFEGVVTATILGGDTKPTFPTTGTTVDFLRELVIGRGTWLGLLFVLWKIMLGWLAFLWTVTGVTLGVGFLTAPLYYGEHIVLNYGLGSIPVVDTWDAFQVAVIGAILVYLSLVVANGLGVLTRRLAEELLSPT